MNIEEKQKELNEWLKSNNVTLDVEYTMDVVYGEKVIRTFIKLKEVKDGD